MKLPPSYYPLAAFATLLIGVSVARPASPLENDGLAGGARWDAAPRMIDGRERSLDGGLRFSVAGGSYEAFRDMFSWQATPSVGEFQGAIEQAFRDWTVVDPESGLGSGLSFVADFATEVVGPEPSEMGNPAGAEIDLLAYVDANSWDPGDPRQRAEVYFDVEYGTVMLTSGTTDYPAPAIKGADIKFNSNPEAFWTLPNFRLVLAHEIGHALGLADVNIAGPEGNFIDDNYDDTSPETALATLTNSWAALVDPLNPANSPLNLYTVSAGSPGLGSPEVYILMESTISTLLLTYPTLLQNDDFGGRQFLYPSLFSHTPGDFDGDGQVGPADYLVWQATFGQPGIGLAADADGNGIVDAADYVLWRNSFATTLIADPIGVVPEPAGLVLALCMVAGVCLGRRPRASA